MPARSYGLALPVTELGEDSPLLPHRFDVSLHPPDLIGRLRAEPRQKTQRKPGWDEPPWKDNPTMSAWKKDFTDAPRDGTQFLAKHERWGCPAVIHYDIDADAFIFSEECIADIDGGIVVPDELVWAPLPA